MKMLNTPTTVKLILSLLLFLCLAHLPYGYYQFVRLAAFAGFIYLAYIELQRNKTAVGIGCVAGAILFNPIFKIAFQRRQWQILDIIVAALLLLWLFIDFKRNKQ